MIVVGLGEPDRRWTAVERYEAALQLVREQKVILVVFTAHERSDAIPDDQVVTPSKHWSYRAVASPVSAVRRVAHVTRAIKFDDAGVFDSENLKRALGLEYRIVQTTPSDAHTSSDDCKRVGVLGDGGDRSAHLSVEAVECLAEAFDA